MAKGYLVSAHRRPADPEKHEAYRELAFEALRSAGGKFLVAAPEATPKEHGLNQRTVVIEFPSYEAALAAYDSEKYQRALEALGDGAERDIRIVEGFDG